MNIYSEYVIPNINHSLSVYYNKASAINFRKETNADGIKNDFK